MLPDNDQYVICLGSNTPDAKQRLDEAADYIARCGSIVRGTDCYPTAPEYAGEKFPYLNRVLVLDCPLGEDGLQTLLKSYESAVRARCVQPGRVNLDIDIVMHGSNVLRPRDFAAKYFKMGFAALHSRKAHEGHGEEAGADEGDGHTAHGAGNIYECETGADAGKKYQCKRET